MSIKKDLKIEGENMEYIIETRKLCKTYKDRGGENIEALKNFDLKIRKGELFTLLGQNGAGKTTLLRILSTVLKPTKGTAYVNGFNLDNELENIKKSIAIVPQDIKPRYQYTPYDYTFYIQKIRGKNKEQAEIDAEKALKIVNMWDYRNRKCGTMSGGEQRRAMIAVAIASNADILMLDEPTSGLDPIAKRKVWDSLRNIINEGRTILLTTHMMEEAEMLSDSLGIIRKGELVYCGTQREIKKKSPYSHKVTIKIPDKEEAIIKKLQGFGDYNNLIGDKLIIFFKLEESIKKITDIVLEENLEATTAPISLEDVFTNYHNADINGEQHDNS